jgi:hypothetical protein
MATRRRPSQPSQLETDAKEFGVGVRCGGWRLGLLVARNVERKAAGRPSNSSLEMDSAAKVSLTKFAEMAGVSQSHVSYYLAAWELAANAGLVSHAESLSPGEEIDVEVDNIEDEDNPNTHWSHFYKLAKKPAKPQQPESNSEIEPSKPNLSVVEDDEEDESDSVDSDFGLPDEASDDERIEADTENQSETLREVLDAIRAQIDRVSDVGEVLGDNDQLLAEIVSAAGDLGILAQAMIDKAAAA